MSIYYKIVPALNPLDRMEPWTLSYNCCSVPLLNFNYIISVRYIEFNRKIWLLNEQIHGKRYHHQLMKHVPFRCVRTRERQRKDVEHLNRYWHSLNICTHDWNLPKYSSLNSAHIDFSHSSVNKNRDVYLLYAKCLLVFYQFNKTIGHASQNLPYNLCSPIYFVMHSALYAENGDCWSFCWCCCCCCHWHSQHAETENQVLH